jgi:hypothetical protein
LLNSVENLLFTIGVKSRMVRSLSWQPQSMRECQLHRTSWAVECPHQSIDRNRNVMLSFCDITNRGNLLAPELELLESRVFAEDLAQILWDRKFCEVCEEDLEWSGGRCECSLWHSRTVNPTLELRANIVTVRYVKCWAGGRIPDLAGLESKNEVICPKRISLSLIRYRDLVVCEKTKKCNYGGIHRITWKALWVFKFFIRYYVEFLF